MNESDGAHLRASAHTAEQPIDAGGNPALRRIASHLAQASGIYALAAFGLRALNLLLLPIYSHFLSPSEYGMVTLAEGIAALPGVLSGLGLDSALRRLYFQYDRDPAQLARFLGTSVRVAALAAGLVVAASLIMGPAFLAGLAPDFVVPFFPYIAITIVTAAGSQLFQIRLALVQVEGRPHRYAVLAACYLLITATSSVLFLVVFHDRVLGLLFGKLVAAAAGILLAVFISRGWLRAAGDWQLARETLRLAVPMVLFTCVSVSLTVADRFVLEHFRSLEEVGLYSFAYPFGMMMFLAGYSVWQAWSPLFFDVARNPGTGRQTVAQITSGLITLLTAVAVLGAFVAQDFVQWALDARYHSAGKLIPLLIGAYWFSCLFWLFQLPLLQEKRAGVVLGISAATLVANLALNLWLTPHYGSHGAAYSLLAAYALQVGVTYVWAQRVYSVPYRWKVILLGFVVLGGSIGLTQMRWAGGARPFAMACGLILAWALLWWASRSNLFRILALVGTKPSLDSPPVR